MYSSRKMDCDSFPAAPLLSSTPNFQRSFLNPLVPCQPSSPLFQPPLVFSLLHPLPCPIPLHSLRPPTILRPLASDRPMRIKGPAVQTPPYPSTNLSFPLARPLFLLFLPFSLRAKWKLAATFSLLKGLFKLETLQSPRRHCRPSPTAPHPPLSFPPTPPPPHNRFSYLFAAAIGRRSPFLADRQPLGPRQCSTTLFCRWKWWEVGLEGERKRGRGKAGVGERELERGQGRAVSRCTSVPSPSHGSFHPD